MATIENVVVGNDDATGSGPYNHLYVGSGGNLVVVTREGSKESPERTTTFYSVAAGTKLENVDVQYVRDTSTTADNIVGWK